MDILTQLNRAMAYIEEHIDDDLALAKVSGVTTHSPFHFGRLFYYITDMPLPEYIRKRKLSLAAIKLQNGSDKIIDLAVLYGYDSADSFTRFCETARRHAVKCQKNSDKIQIKIRWNSVFPCKIKIKE